LVAVEVLKVVMPVRAHEIGLSVDRFFPEDRDLFHDLALVFNRPAFRGTFLWQSDPVPFQRAIKLTLKAANTGVIEDNRGVVTKTIAPITRIQDAKLYATMQHVATHLKTLDNLVEKLKGADVSQRHEIIAEIDKRRDGVRNG
jgi:hypothetical protein